MLLREQIDGSKREIKLQIFASEERRSRRPSRMLAKASIRSRSRPKSRRHGWHRFFTVEDRCYRVSPELRQVSSSRCRTFWPIRRSRVWFAFRAGTSSIYLPARSPGEESFPPIFTFRLAGKAAFCLVGNSRKRSGPPMDDLRSFPSRASLPARGRASSRGKKKIRLAAARRPRGPDAPGPGPALVPVAASRALELCRTMVLDAHGPAAVLISRKLECLFSQGPADRYLKVASGRSSRWM